MSDTQSTIDRIRAAAVDAANSANQSVQKFRNDPRVKKVGNIITDRVDTFNKNISYKQAQQQAQPQEKKKKWVTTEEEPRPQKVVIQKVVVKEKPQSGKIQKAPQKERVSISGTRNDNPFGIGCNNCGMGGPMGNFNAGLQQGHGEPLGRNFVPFNKRKKDEKEDNNPFHF